MPVLATTRLKEAYASLTSSAVNGTQINAPQRRTELRGGQNSLLILCAPDVDAICAARILTTLLKEDWIAFTLVPVSGWSELERINVERIDGNLDLRSIVLINFGATKDLIELDVLSPSPGVRIHVIDSHRPYNLDNLFSFKVPYQDVFIWDQNEVADLDEERRAFEALDAEPDSSSEEEDADTDEEDLNFARRRRERLSATARSPSSSSRSNLFSDNDDDGGGGGSGGGGDQDDESGFSRKRKRRRSRQPSGPSGLSLQDKKRYRNTIRRYYDSGTYFGYSAAGVLYGLAVLKDRADNELLWLAILGLTYQFTAGLVDRERYERFSGLFGDEAARLNLGEQPASSSKTDDRDIRASHEFRFMLLRHWSLYDSMSHSGYIASKLRLWRDRGRKNLQGLLAKMGYSLSQARQSWVHMDMDLKRALPAKIESIAPEYELDDLSFPSFCRSYGMAGPLSASDAVEGLGALLEVSCGVKLDFSGLGGQAEWDSSVVRAWSYGRYGDSETARVDKEHVRAEAPNIQAESDELALVKIKSSAWWVRSFSTAWDAMANEGLLRASLPLSMALHRAIIRQGTSLLEKKAIKSLTDFRLATISEGPDLSVFSHPATLSRLAVWLIDAIRDLMQQARPNAGKGGIKSLPFILASLDERSDAYLVVGMTGAANFDNVKKNKFGRAFEDAAELSGATVQHDGFESSVIQVPRDDLTLFLEKVHLNMATSRI
ncbi:uncharacterized protein L969DRAFT_95680 [Mixia osmundae IAM 14324]|uniref:CDC45-like protein n=1 Tax=Mixia osmundae (strain CBS 9802 / IAM 14324 / JCM 22182 / KY 12970) TaxID=764103 RepID=G7EAA5_MIXOS|nr:uncharacterized protein L969DRAFT_95680 [Mixia osmundae IAM 14324]KEI37824.1 hypothetical protein L969DRAFT_95680 [Mixia osmundae IAM 14324]GAA99765.1 hypothetical protein E5Q_06468 [Mixia osmundae IAM 14324]